VRARENTPALLGQASAIGQPIVHLLLGCTPSFGSLAAIPLLLVVEVSARRDRPAGRGGIRPPGPPCWSSWPDLHPPAASSTPGRGPSPWPGFGPHVVFHVLVVIAGAMRAFAIWRYALPLI
jgi:hypothetical protein